MENDKLKSMLGKDFGEIMKECITKRENEISEKQRKWEIEWLKSVEAKPQV